MTTKRPRKRKSSPVLRKAQHPAHAARAALPISGTPPDLSRGVIVVLSGGGFDLMNPKEVRDRMDLYIAEVNGRRTPLPRHARVVVLEDLTTLCSTSH